MLRTLASTLMLVAAIGGTVTGFWIAIHLRRNTRGSITAIVIGGLASILIAMECGFLGGGWGEELLGGSIGITAGVFGGCFLGAALASLVFSLIGSLIAELFG